MNIIKLAFASIGAFVGTTIFLIVTLPWLWNWIVFIWNSPLPASQASKIYLIDSFMECLPFILTAICGILTLDIVINRRREPELYDIELFPNAKIYSPTPSLPVPQIALEATPKQDLPIHSQSRGVDRVTYETNENGILTGNLEHKEHDTFDGLEQGSKQAINIYKNSDERKANLARMAALQAKIREEEIRLGVNNLHKKRATIEQETSNEQD